MPELPEVEVIRRGLEPHVVGRRIARVRILEPRLVRRRGTPREAETALADRTVAALRRRGKCILFDLGGDTLTVRLGMTGQLRFWPSEVECQADAHTHAYLVLDDGGVVTYRDVRKFGEMFVLPTFAVESALRVGVEPLEDAFTVAALERICRASAMRIKPLLLDQRKVAGIGNIYADEALFRARIRPARRASSLRAGEVRALRQAIRAVLRAGIRHRGSSISDYRDACGKPGDFAALHRVYHRHGQPCRQCGTPIRRIILGQRSTHFCPTCQR